MRNYCYCGDVYLAQEMKISKLREALIDVRLYLQTFHPLALPTIGNIDEALKGDSLSTKDDNQGKCPTRSQS